MTNHRLTVKCEILNEPLIHGHELATIWENLYFDLKSKPHLDLTKTNGSLMFTIHKTR